MGYRPGQGLKDEAYAQNPTQYMLTHSIEWKNSILNSIARQDSQSYEEIISYPFIGRNKPESIFRVE